MKLYEVLENEKISSDYIKKLITNKFNLNKYDYSELKRISKSKQSDGTWKREFEGSANTLYTVISDSSDTNIIDVSHDIRTKFTYDRLSYLIKQGNIKDIEEQLDIYITQRKKDYDDDKEYSDKHYKKYGFEDPVHFAIHDIPIQMILAGKFDLAEKIISDYHKYFKDATFIQSSIAKKVFMGLRNAQDDRKYEILKWIIDTQVNKNDKNEVSKLISFFNEYKRTENKIIKKISVEYPELFGNNK